MRKAGGGSRVDFLQQYDHCEMDGPIGIQEIYLYHKFFKDSFLRQSDEREASRSGLGSFRRKSRSAQWSRSRTLKEVSAALRGPLSIPCVRSGVSAEEVKNILSQKGKINTHKKNDLLLLKIWMDKVYTFIL